MKPSSIQHIKSRIFSNEQLVDEYFKRISESPIGTLELFTDDAVVYEPFSVDNGLHGKDEIAPFLRIAQIANRGLEKKISFSSIGKHEIEASVQFTRGTSVKGRFQFKTQDIKTDNGMEEKRIRELKIQFLK